MSFKTGLTFYLRERKTCSCEIIELVEDSIQSNCVINSFYVSQGEKEKPFSKLKTLVGILTSDV